MNGLMDFVWTVGWMSGRIDGRNDEGIGYEPWDRWVNRWLDGLMDKSMDER